MSNLLWFLQRSSWPFRSWRRGNFRAGLPPSVIILKAHSHCLRSGAWTMASRMCYVCLWSSAEVLTFLWWFLCCCFPFAHSRYSRLFLTVFPTIKRNELGARDQRIHRHFRPTWSSSWRHPYFWQLWALMFLLTRTLISVSSLVKEWLSIQRYPTNKQRYPGLWLGRAGCSLTHPLTPLASLYANRL